MDIRSSQAASPSLSILKDLHESVDDFLQLQHTSENLQGSVEMVLDGSLRVLDVCSITRDIFSQMRRSSNPRRKIGESELKSAIEGNMASRKRLHKAASKCFKNSNKNDEYCLLAISQSPSFHSQHHQSLVDTIL